VTESPPFVPDGFEPPTAFDDPRFRLRPLGPEHNESDYAAWTSSMDHIHRTPGFKPDGWPRPMTFEENRADLVRHAGDFKARTGFTFTVLAPDTDAVIGCVYIYPSSDGPGAGVSSWVRATDAHLDEPLYRAVSDWLAADWPFERVVYDPRS
jgi:RimJ/RimL family protein N-acetyltransferase